MSTKFENRKKKEYDPESILGSLMLYGTNRMHAKVLNWGLSCFSGIKPKEIAELGCGSGRNVSVLLLNYPDARVSVRS